MRIISQNGKGDLPYEKIVIYLSCEQIIAKHEEAEYMLATYSSEEKAVKAMEMCREKYLSRMELNGGYDIVHSCYVQPNYWVLPKVFQFPKEEEIE